MRASSALGSVQLTREQLRLFAAVRQELVQRRIEQPDVDRVAVHRLEDRLEVGALHREQLGERAPPSALVARDDHLAHGVNAVALEEHVLGATQADPFGAERRAPTRVLRRVGVGAHLEPARFVGPARGRARTPGTRARATR